MTKVGEIFVFFKSHRSTFFDFCYKQISKDKKSGSGCNSECGYSGAKSRLEKLQPAHPYVSPPELPAHTNQHARLRTRRIWIQLIKLCLQQLKWSDMHNEHPVDSLLWGIPELADLVQQTWTWCTFGCCDHSTGRYLRIPCHVQTSDRKLCELLNERLCLSEDHLGVEHASRQEFATRSSITTRPKEFLDTVTKVLFSDDINLEEVLSEVNVEVKPELWEPEDDPICFACLKFGHGRCVRVDTPSCGSSRTRGTNLRLNQTTSEI